MTNVVKSYFKHYCFDCEALVLTVRINQMFKINIEG